MTHRFFVPSEHGYTVNERITLPPEMAHQMRTVLRLQPGSAVVVLDDRGWEYEAVVEGLHRNGGSAVVVAVAPCTGEPRTQLTLFMSLLKRDNFEWVLQKGTELGVARFVPVVTRRTVVTAVKANKEARWQRIMQEAAEQSRRGRLPLLTEPVDWTTALAQAAGCDAAFIPWEGATHAALPVHLETGPTATAALFIGPEGGYEAEEVRQAQDAGVQPVTLGARILRAETAAVAAVTLLMSALGELGPPAKEGQGM